MAQEKHDGPYVSQATGRSGTDRVDVARRRANTPFPLDGMDADELWGFIKRVLQNGDLASLTLTSDAGALSVTITSNGTRFRAFAKDGDEFLTASADLCAKVYGD